MDHLFEGAATFLTWCVINRLLRYDNPVVEGLEDVKNGNLSGDRDA